MKNNINYKDVCTRKFKAIKIGEWTVANAIFSKELKEHAEAFGKRFAIKRVGGFMKVARVK